MSAFVTYALPMTNTQSLLAALEAMGISRSRIEVVSPNAQEYEGYRCVKTLPGLTDGSIRVSPGEGSIYDSMSLAKTSTGYQLSMSPYAMLGTNWQVELPKEYRRQHEIRLEALAAEKRRIEQEDRERESARLVAAQRALVLQKAKQMGYRVEESRVGEKIRLVLCRRVF